MVKPPKPPFGCGIHLDSDGNLTAVQGWKTWRTPVAGASVQTLDNTGKRITITRLALIGPFALAARKKTGELTVVLVGADGDTATVKVKPGKAQDVAAWAIAFNAWSEANRL
ncbi:MULTISPECIES: hypothetical protein [Kitasatospora]|uniref:Uncharacterized protein n=1 Tax=Kitasatospora cystarginea TaxID=58350 RepID=A0ABN3DZC5_9ACTN